VSRFKQFDRIAIRIFKLDLLAAGSILHLIPKNYPSFLQRFDLGGQVFNLQNYPISTSRFWLATVRHHTL